MSLKKDGMCPQCEARNVMEDIRVVDQNRTLNAADLSVEVFERPHALLNQGAHYGTLRAWICGTCGYTEIYASNPAELLAAYRKSQR